MFLFETESGLQHGAGECEGVLDRGARESGFRSQFAVANEPGLLLENRQLLLLLGSMPAPACSLSVSRPQSVHNALPMCLPLQIPKTGKGARKWRSLSFLIDNQS